MGKIGEMSSREWAIKYAPFGYAYYKCRLSFETLERAVFPSQIMEIEMDRLRRGLAREAPDFDERHVFTFISIWPKEIGENVNHLDPLKPRMGIEIEIRYPTLVVS